MGNIIRSIVEIGIVSLIIVMSISTGLMIINQGGTTVEFIVDNQRYMTASSMDFSSITIDSSYITFNDTGFYVHSANDITISISYIRPDIGNANHGDHLLSFSADTNGGTVWFNISGFFAGTGYLVKKDGVDFTTINANPSGFISFSNSEWSSHNFDIYQLGDSNTPPNPPSNPNPEDGSSNIAIDVLLSWSCSDPDGDSLTYDVYLDTVTPPLTKKASNHSESSFNPSSLSYDTLYYWQIIAWDTHGARGEGAIWSFSTGDMLDEEPPVISNGNVAFSNPMDTIIGWVNISCDVTDNVAVDMVWVNISYPNDSTENVSLTNAGDGSYYYTTTFSAHGIYDYFFFAQDTSGNTVVSSTNSFTIYANWDINMDGVCDIIDLLAVSNTFGLSGPPGWIREDVNNDGEVRVLDLVIVDSYLGESYDVEP